MSWERFISYSDKDYYELQTFTGQLINNFYVVMRVLNEAHVANLMPTTRVPIAGTITGLVFTYDPAVVATFTFRIGVNGVDIQEIAIAGDPATQSGYALTLNVPVAQGDAVNIDVKHDDPKGINYLCTAQLRVEY